MSFKVITDDTILFPYASIKAGFLFKISALLEILSLQLIKYARDHGIYWLDSRKDAWPGLGASNRLNKHVLASALH